MPRTKTGTDANTYEFKYDPVEDPDVILYSGEEVKTGTGRKPGRPKGAKNKPKKGTGTDLKTGTGEETKEGTGKKRGRKKKGAGEPKSKYNMSPAALAIRRANSAPARTDEEREYNAKMISHVMKIHEISLHADRNDINSLRSCFAAYIQLCQEDGFKIGNIAASTALGITHNLLYSWSKGEAGQEKKELALFIRSMCSTARELQITEGKINPVVGIFHQRNFDGLRNDTEQQQNNQVTDPEEETSNKYLEKYSHLIEE